MQRTRSSQPCFFSAPSRSSQFDYRELCRPVAESTLRWPLTFSSTSCGPRRSATVPRRLSGTSSTEEISAQPEQLTRFCLRGAAFHHSWNPTTHTHTDTRGDLFYLFIYFFQRKGSKAIQNDSKSNKESVTQNTRNCFTGANLYKCVLGLFFFKVKCENRFFSFLYHNLNIGNMASGCTKITTNNWCLQGSKADFQLNLKTFCLM